MPILTPNELYQFKSESNSIPKLALKELYEKIKAESPTIASILRDGYIGNWDDETNPWFLWTTEKYQWKNREYAGNWTTRFSKLYQSLVGDKIQPDHLEYMGSFLGQAKKPIDYFFEVRKAFDWRPGDFKERDNTSCWWSDRKSSRYGMLGNDDGYVVLIFGSREQYEKDKGLKGNGRAWALNYDDRAFIFNAYGSVSLSSMAIALANQFSINQKRVTVYSEGSYINTGNQNNETRGGGEYGLAYILAPDVSKFKGDRDDAITIRSLAHSDIRCSHCSKPHSPIKSELKDGKLYCEACIAKLFPKCFNCGKLEAGELIFHNGSYRNMCNSCVQQHEIKSKHHYCTTHGYCTAVTHQIWHSNERLCTTCLSERNIKRCNNCGRLTKVIHIQVGKVSTGYMICKGCTKNLITNMKAEIQNDRL